jgi:DNA-directed RNA polymerase subunit RPC12/RpoP
VARMAQHFPALWTSVAGHSESLWPDVSIAKVTAPKCCECGASSPRVWTSPEGTHLWLCSSCEYKILFPEALPAKKDPRAMRPLKLQDERLFTL